MLLLWRLVYPLLIYDAAVTGCFWLLPVSDPLLGQGVAAAMTVLILMPFYTGRRRRMRTGKAAEGRLKDGPAGSRDGSGRRILLSVFRFAVIGAASSVFLNNLINLSGLDRLLTGYEQVSDMIFGSPFRVQLLMSGILIPAAEEMIFRGLDYTALRARFSVTISMSVSSFLFGIFHGNPLQFVYAFAIGLILAWCYEEEDGLWAPVLVHVAANLVSIVLQNAAAEDYRTAASFWIETILAGACLWQAMKGYNYRKGRPRTQTK